MSLFKNQSFVTTLAEPLAGQTEIQPEAALLILALVENETRKLLESAKKFMNHQKRQELNLDDLNNSLRYLNIRDFKLTPEEYIYDPQQNKSMKNDPTITNLDNYINEQLKQINLMFKIPELKARWVYLNQMVPKIEQNISITLRQSNELKSKEQQQINKMFNVIRDKPLSLLTKQQEFFFKQIIVKLQNGEIPQISSINLNQIFPFLINYILNSKSSDVIVIFLLQILKNKYLEKHIQMCLHQILSYFIGYEGEYSWEVGIVIAQLIQKWGYKYKNLYELFFNNVSKSNQSYSTKIKKLAIEITNGINMKIDISTLQMDIDNQVALAQKFVILINQCSLKLKHQTDYHKFFTEGMAGLQSDCYLDMHL